MIEKKERDWQKEIDDLKERADIWYKAHLEDNKYYNKTSVELRDIKRKCDVEHVSWDNAVFLFVIIAALAFFTGMTVGYGVKRIGEPVDYLNSTKEKVASYSKVRYHIIQN